MIMEIQLCDHQPRLTWDSRCISALLRQGHRQSPVNVDRCGNQSAHPKSQSYGTLLSFKKLQETQCYAQVLWLLHHAKQKPSGIDELKFDENRANTGNVLPSPLCHHDRCTNQVRSAEFNWLQPVSLRASCHHSWRAEQRVSHSDAQWPTITTFVCQRLAKLHAVDVCAYWIHIHP